MFSTSFSLPCPNLLGVEVKVHLSFFILLIFEFLLCLRFIHDYPLFSVLVIILYGPILLATVLVHEWGHVFISRQLLGEDAVTEVVLWPLGGYTYCDRISTTEELPEPAEGVLLTTDLKIALVGPLMHVPMSLFWVGMYAAINLGDMSEFTFRMYFTIISRDLAGFLSTLFEQSCLMNILLMWFNIFVPAYPLDGGRLVASTILLLAGVALNKTAFLTCLVTLLISLALFAWSIASFFDGVGTTGVFAALVAIYLSVSSYRLYLLILHGGLRKHPLFGRTCYVNRIATPPIFQLTISRSAAAVDAGGDDEPQNIVRDDVTNATLETEDWHSARETNNIPETQS